MTRPSPLTYGEAGRALKALNHDTTHAAARAAGRPGRPNHDDDEAGRAAAKRQAVAWGFSTREGHPTDLARLIERSPSMAFSDEPIERELVKNVLFDAGQVRRMDTALVTPELLTAAERADCVEARKRHAAAVSRTRPATCRRCTSGSGRRRSCLRTCASRASGTAA
ncbi:hypothetical protein [Sphingomonas arantia]|uniref:hypothetical protein n=1 Tax=Sphingomonas arantia TaxID=1460676 RepID=UPI0036D3E8C8